MPAIGAIAIASFAEPPETDNSSPPDTLDLEKNTLSILPFVFYSPETKLAVGIMPKYIFRVSPACRPSSVSFPGFFSTNKQISIAFQPELYLAENKHIISGGFYYEKWPDTFYGIGSESSIEHEDYTAKNSGISLDYQRKVALSLYLGVGFDFSRREYVEILDGGLLASGDIMGAETGARTGTGLSITWDDRDNVFYPADGNYHQFTATYYGTGFGGVYTFKKYILDMRKYQTVTAKNIIAFQAFAISTDGEPPFWTIPRLGDVIRGYYPSLFIEKNMLAFQAEYRIHPLWKRWGIVAFAGTGAIADEFSNFRISKFRLGAGFGIRYLFVPQEKLNIRVDLGIGSESTELYVNIDEAF